MRPLSCVTSLARIGLVLWIWIANPATAAASERLHKIPRLDNPVRAVSAPEAFAWDVFIATNWPALAGRRGVPDPDRTLGRHAASVGET